MSQYDDRPPPIVVTAEHTGERWRASVAIGGTSYAPTASETALGSLRAALRAFEEAMVAQAIAEAEDHARTWGEP